MTKLDICSCASQAGFAAAFHRFDCPLYVKSSINPELAALLSNLNEVRGDPRAWIRKELALSTFIAGLNDKNRVLCKGEYRTKTVHLPAVLVYNIDIRSPVVWIPEGDDDTMVSKDIHDFYSTIPHVGMARESLMDRSDANNTL